MVRFHLPLALAAVSVVVQNCVYYVVASDESQHSVDDSEVNKGDESDTQGSVSDMFPSFLQLWVHLPSLSSFFPPDFGDPHGIGSIGGLGVSLDGGSSCRIKIDLGVTVDPEDIKVSAFPAKRLVKVSFDKSVHEHQDGRGSTRSSMRHVDYSSSILLPDRCILTTASVSARMCGYILNSGAEGKTNGVIILPSQEQLVEYVKEGVLPDNIIEAASSGDTALMSSLTEAQLCLVVGFTTAECEKFGNKKPELLAANGQVNEVEFHLSRYNAELDTA